MRSALRELGYRNVYHMTEIIHNPPDAIMWKEAFEAKHFGKGKKFGKAEWDALLGDYEVGTYPARKNLGLPSTRADSA